MKIVIVVYNSSINDHIMEALTDCRIEEYTKIPNVFGVGRNSGPHMGTHIWPATNSLLMISCNEDEARMLLDKLTAIKEKYSKLGIKAFVVNQEEAV